MRTFSLEDIPKAEFRYPDLQGNTVIVTGGERGIGTPPGIYI